MKSLMLVLLFCHGTLMAREDSLIYHPNADARQEMAAALQQAKAEQKHLVLMIGGNWCRWCRMFERFRLTEPRVDSLVKRDFVWLHVNFSKENKNPELMKALSYPQRFGFPVFVILDAEGKVLHTQQSGYLESGEGYSTEKVVDFLHQWRREALLEETYR